MTAGEDNVCRAAFRRLASRASARRDAVPVIVVLALFAALLLRDFAAWLRDEATRRDALRLYAGAATREDGAHAAARLCLRGVGVPADTLGPAAWAPLPPFAPREATDDDGEGLIPGVVRGQFRRLPRVGARGLPPGALRYGLWTLANFSGDFVLTKAKYGRRAPGSRIVLPRPMRECAAATPAAANTLPAACDAVAARVGRAQGYAPVGAVSHELLMAVPDRDPLRLFPRYASCALVGPHAGRGAPGAGAAIDAAAAVFRVAGPDGRVPPQPAALAGRHTHVLLLGPDASAAAVARGTDRDEEGLHSAQRLAPLRLHVVTTPAALNATLRWQQRNPLSNAAVADADLHQLALDLHGGRAPPAAFYALVIAAARCEHVTLFGFTCDRKDAPAADAEADLQAGPGGAWSADDAAAAVAAEEKAWRIFIARRGAQVAFAREGAAAPPPPRRASPAGAV